MNGFNGHGDLGRDVPPRHRQVPRATRAAGRPGGVPGHGLDAVPRAGHRLPRLRGARRQDGRARAPRHGAARVHERGRRAASRQQYDAQMRDYFFGRNAGVGDPHHLHAPRRRGEGREGVRPGPDRAARSATRTAPTRSSGASGTIRASASATSRCARGRAARAYYLCLWRRRDLWDADAARGGARRAARRARGGEGVARGRARAARLGDDDADARAPRALRDDVVAAAGADAWRPLLLRPPRQAGGADSRRTTSRATGCTPPTAGRGADARGPEPHPAAAVHRDRPGRTRSCWAPTAAARASASRC